MLDRNESVSYGWLSNERNISTTVAKTVLAEFVEQHKGELEVAWWVSAEDKQGGRTLRVVKSLDGLDTSQRNCHVYCVNRKPPSGAPPKDALQLSSAMLQKQLLERASTMGPQELCQHNAVQPFSQTTTTARVLPKYVEPAKPAPATKSLKPGVQSSKATTPLPEKVKRMALNPIKKGGMGAFLAKGKGSAPKASGKTKGVIAPRKPTKLTAMFKKAKAAPKKGKGGFKAGAASQMSMTKAKPVKQKKTAAATKKKTKKSPPKPAPQPSLQEMEFDAESSEDEQTPIADDDDEEEEMRIQAQKRGGKRKRNQIEDSDEDDEEPEAATEEPPAKKQLTEKQREKIEAQKAKAEAKEAKARQKAEAIARKAAKLSQRKANFFAGSQAPAKRAANPPKGGGRRKVTRTYINPEGMFVTEDVWEEVPVEGAAPAPTRAAPAPPAPPSQTVKAKPAAKTKPKSAGGSAKKKRKQKSLFAMFGKKKG